MASEKETLANVVKALHKRLKTNLKAANGDFEKVWKDHCSDKDSLQNYATAMHSLATDQWTKNSPGGRADWCVKTCQEYFKSGGLIVAIEKQKRRFEKEMATSCCCCLNIVSSTNYFDSDSFVEDKLNLLDVGSCYDPFSMYQEFSSVAIDLHPATVSVYKCDFLNLEVSSEHTSMNTGAGSKEVDSTFTCSCETNNLQYQNNDDEEQNAQENNASDFKAEKTIPSFGSIFPHSQEIYDIKTFLQNPVVSELPGAYFHVVVFSLLLSYFPTPAQRWTCCVKAHQLLAVNGILIIITPDSSHQNRNAAMMKSWKAAIESIGFVRWRYLKDTHVHCMVFRKVSPCHHSCSRTCSCKTSIDITPEMLFLHHDFCDDDNDDLMDGSSPNGRNDSQQQRKKRKVDISQ